MSTDERGMDADGWDDVAMTRRATLRAAGALGLGGCCSWPRADSPPPPRLPARRRAKRGGQLRVGHVGAGKGESFNPGRGSSFIDASRYYNLYDPLVRVNPDFSQSPGLALQWTPNATRRSRRSSSGPASSGTTARRSPPTT